MANPTPVPSNVPKPQPLQTTGSSQPSALSVTAPSPRIKAEPGTASYPVPQYSAFEPNYTNNDAQQRAAALIRQKVGPDADLHIQQLQRHAGDQHQAQRSAPHPGNIQLPQQLSDQQRREYAERQRLQAMHQMRQSQQAQQRPAVGNLQTDGANDWATMVAQHHAYVLANPTVTLDADMTFREMFKRTNTAMEGGGMMMPLNERPTQPKLKKRRTGTASAANPSNTSVNAAFPQDSGSSSTIVQLDGQDSDEDTKGGIKPESDLEDDEDAINSDLDDPDDNAVNEDRDDDDEAEIMACTYDKVARVKNKWKCTLKDGILNTGGRE